MYQCCWNTVAESPNATQVIWLLAISFTEGNETQIFAFKETINVLSECHFTKNMLFIWYAEVWELTTSKWNKLTFLHVSWRQLCRLLTSRSYTGAYTGVRSLLVSYGDSNVWPGGLLQAIVTFTLCCGILLNQNNQTRIQSWQLWTINRNRTVNRSTLT